MTTIIVLGVLCLIMAFLVALFHVKRIQKPKFVLKIAASLCFCAAGVVALFVRGSVDVFSALILAAFILGLVGDILLCLFAFLKEEYKTFFYIVGGGSFLLGHVLYVIAFISLGGLRAALLPIVLLIPAIYLILMKTKILNPGGMKLPLLAYAVVLSAMLMSTVDLAVQGLPIGVLVLAAGILFALSDTALFLGDYGNETVKKARVPLMFIVLLCYYAAQMLFAASILYI